MERLDAEEFSATTITTVVPMASGGTTDFLPRIMGDLLRKKWKRRSC